MTLLFVEVKKNRLRQRLAGEGYTLPLIAKCAMNGALVRLGMVEEKGMGKGEIQGPLD
jgi:hypothetical protein